MRENHLGKEEGNPSLPKTQGLPENMPEDKRCELLFPLEAKAQPYSPWSILPDTG